jgi:hypothetical protein
VTSDLARAEDIAAALPRDYTADLHSGPYVRTVCIDCGQVFKGRVYRSVCAVCAPKAKP